MQGERSILEPFAENIDLNQGSGSNNAAMDGSAAWNNVLNPVESRLSNHVLSAGERNADCMNLSSDNGRSFGGWDPGESSSRANIQSQLNGHGLKMGEGWSPSTNTCVVADGRSADWQSEQPNIFLHESNTNDYVGNNFHGPLSVHNPISNCSSLNTCTSGGAYRSNSDDSWLGRGAGMTQNFYRAARSEMDHFPAFGAASDDVGTSSGGSGYIVQHDDGSGSSTSTWSLSCKRKALEGNHGRSCSSGNLSMDPQDETVGRHNVPARYNASSSLTIAAPPTTLQNASNLGQLNPIVGSGVRGVTYDGLFPPLSVNEIAESSQRNFGFGTDLGQQEPSQFDLAAARADVRHSSAHSTRHQSRLISTTESPGLRAPFSRPANLNSTVSQSPLMQVPGSARNRLPFPWNGSLNSRGSASSSPILFSGERGAVLRDETTFRSSLSNNLEHSSFVPAPETRHMIQEPSNWSFSPGNTVSSRNLPSSSRTTPSSGIRPFSTVWMPHQNPTAHNQQRLSEFHPWTLFPPVEPELAGHTGQISLLPSASSSSEEAVMSSGSSSGDHQPYSRSLLMEVFSDNINGWRALAADIDGRHRIVSEIRQVLNAMRRAENWRAQDYMLFDPFINGAADLQDRHRDMRLDVDNMSYEELLALEERIGNVSTGLSEDAVSKSMTQRKHHLFVAKASSNLEPCCICQEDYIIGDDIGTLDCGHEFHTDCIKQWLTLKNLCPICKMTALET